MSPGLRIELEATSWRPCLRLCSRLVLSMSPKRGRPSAAAKGKAPLQQQLEQMPLIKKPLELIGEYINVPGAFWQGNGAAEVGDQHGQGQIASTC